MKEHQVLMYRGKKPPDNEIIVQKQQELDAYLNEINHLKKKIRIKRADLEKDENFRRMIDSENQAKE